MSDLYTFTDADVLDVIDSWQGEPMSVRDVASEAITLQLRTSVNDPRVETVIQLRGTGRFRDILYGLRDSGVLAQMPTAPLTFARVSTT